MLSIIWPYDLILSRHTHQQPNYISRHGKLCSSIDIYFQGASCSITSLFYFAYLQVIRQTFLYSIHFRGHDTMTLIPCASWYTIYRESQPFHPSSWFVLLRFLAKNPSDKSKSDDASRWWPDWYQYSRDSISNDIVFGTRILIQPNVNPDASKFIQWADTVDLHSDGSAILAPFDFESISPSNWTRNLVPLNIWMSLFKICTSQGILPPTISKLLRFWPNPNLLGDIGHKRKC